MTDPTGPQKLHCRVQLGELLFLFAALGSSNTSSRSSADFSLWLE